MDSRSGNGKPATLVNKASLLAAVGRPVRHRALLVEDYEPLAEATAEFMRNAGLEVQIASSGQDALRVAAAFKPEIVLCDLRLPDIMGLDVARALREVPGAKDAVIAIHTAISDVDHPVLKRHLNAPSVNLFLSKPLTDEKLKALISAVQFVPRPAPRRNK
jgi:DNA-binding response OmpR family regulator